MSICIIWGHPPRNSIKSEGHWVTSGMAVYLEEMVGAMRRSTDSGVCYADGNRKGRKQNAFFPP